MAKKRTDIPKPIREKVLKEYHYLCAVCGQVNPQLHHIDRAYRRNVAKFRDGLSKSRNKVYELLVELLRYQSWRLEIQTGTTKHQS